jgi:AAHS family 4-hydroxybenzoate transporter-like MFS transporter
MAVGVFCMLLVTYLLNSWTPMIAVRSGFAPGMAALCGVLLNLGGIVGALLSTLLVRKFGLFKLVAVMITGGALAIAALGQLYGSIGALMCGLFVAGALAIGGQQNTPAMAVQLYPQRMRAAGAGWQFAVGRLGSILGPITGGHLVASGIAPQTMFVVVAIPTLLAAVAYAAVDYVRPK